MKDRKFSLGLILNLGFICIAAATFLVMQQIYLSFAEKGWISEIRQSGQVRSETLAYMVQQDILSGFYPNIVEKCSRTLEQKDVLSIQLKLADGYTVFDKQQKAADRSPDQVLDLTIPVKSPVYDVTSNAPPTTLGTVRVVYDLTQVKEKLRQQQINAFLIFVLLIAISTAFIYILSRLVSAPLLKLQRVTSSRVLASIAEYRGDSNITEISNLETEFSRLGRQVLDYQQQLVERTRQAAVGQVAAQVAHDIRSPLAALEVFVEGVVQLPEEKRTLVRSAVTRIRDIANNLIEDSRPYHDQLSGIEPRSEASSQLVSNIVDVLVSEKRMQFRSRTGVRIEYRFNPSSYGLCARVNPSDFKRVLSNLINNAVEAIDETGLVEISLAATADGLVLKITDDGKGVGRELLPELFKKGKSFGKPGGTGLGLYHAKTFIGAWGGSVTLASEAGSGTTVTVLLPRTDPPGWFLSALILRTGAVVVVIDDDSSIHQIWQGRFDSLRASEHGISSAHHASAEECETWFGARKDELRGKDVVYLADYELLGSRKNGLQLIEELGIAKQSVLVTSRYEEEAIREQCAHLGVRLIPKNMAGFIPITISSAKLERPDAILLDDDTLVHLSWKAAARIAGRTLEIFSDGAALLAAKDRFDRAVPLYIDSSLANGEKGEDVAKTLHEAGFTEIFIATGHEPGRFAALTWLKGVVGKDPPWTDVTSSRKG